MLKFVRSSLRMVLFAQTFKILSGIAQLVAGTAIVVRRRTAVAVTFAIAFGANGIAYAIFNTARPGQRSPQSFAVEGRGAFNWLAVVAMVLFGLLYANSTGRRRWTWLMLPMLVAGTMLVGTVVEAGASRIDWLGFGGLAIYPTTAFAIVLLTEVFSVDNRPQVRSDCAWLSAALVINSVDHLGAGLGVGSLQPGPLVTPTNLVQIAIFAALLVWWAWNASITELESRWLAVLVIACIIVPFVSGVLVRSAVGSYRAVQESGFIGVGRVVASGLLLYALRKHHFFEPAPLTAAVAGARD